MKDFYFELLDLIKKEAASVRAEWKPGIRKILSDMVVLGESLKKRNWSGEDDVAFMGLTYNAYQFSIILRRRLPDNLHSRIVLGRQNEWTRGYVWMWRNSP